MSEYIQYRRSAIAEIAEWTPETNMERVSISDADKDAGSPKPGDMIARNPKNHDDRWLIAADYFADNFEPIPESVTQRPPHEHELPVSCYEPDEDDGITIVEPVFNMKIPVSDVRETSEDGVTVTTLHCPCGVVHVLNATRRLSASGTGAGSPTRTRLAQG